MPHNTQAAGAATLTDQQIYDRFGFLEGVVNERYYHQIAKQAIAIRDAALAAPSAPTDPVRVACVTLDGTTLTVPVDQIGDVLHGEDDQHTYTLTLKTMTRAEFDALGEFNGF